MPIALLNVALVGLRLPAESNVTAGIAVFIHFIVVIVVWWRWMIAKRAAEEERSRQVEEERRKRDEQREEERRREQQERAEQIEALRERDGFRESVYCMSGVEFEDFMANVFEKKGYHVQTTPATGGSGSRFLAHHR